MLTQHSDVLPDQTDHSALRPFSTIESKTWFLRGEHCRSQKHFKMGLKVVSAFSSLQPTVTHNTFLCVGPETFLCVSAWAFFMHNCRVRDTSLENYQRSVSLVSYSSDGWMVLISVSDAGYGEHSLQQFSQIKSMTSATEAFFWGRNCSQGFRLKQSFCSGFFRIILENVLVVEKGLEWRSVSLSVHEIFELHLRHIRCSDELTNVRYVKVYRFQFLVSSHFKTSRPRCSCSQGSWSFLSCLSCL